MYKLRAGEYVKDGKLYGWTGNKCYFCKGWGEDAEARKCSHCSGTGEEHGLMSTQPPNLPPDTE